MKVLFILGFVALGWYLRGEKIRILETASQVVSSQSKAIKKVLKQEYESVKKPVDKAVDTVNKKVKEVKPKATYVTQKMVVDDATYKCTEFKSDKIQFKRCDKVRY